MQGAADSRKAVETLLRQRLLARYQAYRAKGLSGISPYARESGEQLNVGEELLLATQADKVVAKHAPLFHNILLKYPAVDASGFEEWFYWLNVEVFGRPIWVLSHRMLFKEGETYLAAERHFYAGREYNGLQSVAGLLPTKDGTILIYLNRVSTEQVAGFGSSVKHPVARGLMGPYIEDLFEGIRAEAEKQ